MRVAVGAVCVWGLVGLASPAAADDPRGVAPAVAPSRTGAPTDDEIRSALGQLRGPTAGYGVRALGVLWERTLAEAAWDDRAEVPRAYAARVSPALRTFAAPREGSSSGAPEDRRLALGLLAELGDPGTETFFRNVVAGTTDARWVGIAAFGLARLGTPTAREAIRAAFVARVPPEGTVPPEEAWALCHATARVQDAAPIAPDVAAAAERLFLYAPQMSVQSCLPLLGRLSNMAELARRVIDEDRWPLAITQGRDPRDPDSKVAYGRGAALLVLGELRTDDAFDRLEAGLADRDDGADPVRDGAVQGLASLGGDRARRLLRQALADPVRRSPRVAHALLRLGDQQSVSRLRRTALDPRAIVDLRLAAANAYTILVRGRPGLARAWDRDLARVGPIGTPFEALDARLTAFAGRLSAAERCRGRVDCWAETLDDADPQASARAFWELAQTAPAEGDVAVALAAVAARTLESTPPNEQHDRVAGAVALLARVSPEVARVHIAAVRRARAAWEGRTNPMGLPFDIPLAMGQLERSLARAAVAPPPPAP